MRRAARRIPDQGRPVQGHTRIIRYLLLGLYILFFSLLASDSLRYHSMPVNDAREYLVLAHNVALHGSFSLSREEPPGRAAPTARRSPGYPFLLALAFRSFPDLGDLELPELFQPESQTRLWPLKLANAFLLLATSLLVLKIVWEITGDYVFSYATLALVGLDGTLHWRNQFFLAGVLCMFLLALFSLCAVLIAKRGNHLALAPAGFLLALLALTRASYYYFWLPVAALLVYLCLRKGLDRRRLIIGTALFLVCFFVPVWSWMARNHAQFDRFFLTDGGGLILKIRAETNMMTREEYLASFLYWSGSWSARELLLPQLFEESVTTRLNRMNAESFLGRAIRRSDELRRQFRSTVAADRRLLQEARGEILCHPVRHALVTLPVAVRGLNVQREFVISLAIFSSFFWVLIVGWMRNDLPVIAALTPAALSYLFHSLFTHNLPRYNSIVVPALWIGTVLFLRYVGRMAVRPGSG